MNRRIVGTLKRLAEVTMFWTSVWIGLALLLGFYLGVTLMSVLAIAGQAPRDDARPVPSNLGRQHARADGPGPGRRTGQREVPSPQCDRRRIPVG
jgi:hypothetical protein